MVKFSAHIESAFQTHRVSVQTGEPPPRPVDIAPKAGGYGSSMNGAEALLLALATCYCNDLYHEAERQGMTVRQVRVSAEGSFDGVPGHPITDIVYHVTVEAEAAGDAIEALIRHTDTVAEIQNTLRQGVAVTLGMAQAITANGGDSR